MIGRDRQRRSALVAGIAALSGCLAPTDHSVELPPDVRWVALIEEGESRRVSELVAWAPGRALPIFAKASARLLIVGFSDEQLTAAGAPADRAGPLAIAEPCTPRLPEPLWVGRAGPDELQTVEISNAPALSAPWLVPAECRQPPTELIADVTCAPIGCAATGRTLEGCGVALGLTGCGAVAITGAVLGDTLCLDLSAAPWACRAAPAAPGALASYACEADAPCRIDVYPKPPAAPPFTVDVVDLAPGPDTLPKDLVEGGILIGESLLSGRLFDMAVLADRIVVTGDGGEAGAFCGTGTSTTTKISIIHPDTLEVLSTADGPPCLTKIAPDPWGTGFIGVHGGGGVLSIARFNAAGFPFISAPVDDRPVDTPPQDPRFARLSTHWVLSLDYVTNPGYAAVFLEWRREVQETGGFLLFGYGLPALGAVARQDFYVGRLWAVTAFDDQLFVGADEASGRVGWVEYATTKAREQALLPPPVVGERRDIVGVAAHSPSGLAAVLVSWPAPQIHVVDFDGPKARARFFDRDVVPTRAITWPGDERLMLVTGSAHTADTGFEVVAGFLDPTEGRMRPGSWRIGSGAVSRIIEDADGRLWALAPWSGEVIRITP